MKKGSCIPIVFSQVIYSGGYSDGEPPLPIPNREAKPVIADGTARPGGRVGSCRSSDTPDEKSSGVFFFIYTSVTSIAVAVVYMSQSPVLMVLFQYSGFGVSFL